MVYALCSSWRDISKAEVMKAMPSPEEVADSYCTMTDHQIMGWLLSLNLSCAMVCEKYNEIDDALVSTTASYTTAHTHVRTHKCTLFLCARVRAYFSLERVSCLFLCLSRACFFCFFFFVVVVIIVSSSSSFSFFALIQCLLVV